MMPKTSTPRGQRRQGVFLLSLLLCLLASPPLALAADIPPEDIVIVAYYNPFGDLVYVIVPKGSLNPEYKGKTWWTFEELFGNSMDKEKEKSKDKPPEIDKI